MRKVIWMLILVLCLVTTASAESPDAVENTLAWYESLGICAGIALVIGGIGAGIMASSMKSVRQRGGASDYVSGSGLELRIHQDRYLYQTIIRRPRPKNNNRN